MPTDPRLKGYSLALLATLAGSTVYIFSKAALNQISLAQFGVYWFAFAIFWNVLYALRLPKFRAFPLIRGHSFRMLMLIGLIELIATGAFYIAINTSENPAIPSFLRNMEYIFVTLMGVMILKERFSLMEMLGVILTFSGAMVISYDKGLTFTSFITGTSGFMLLSTSFYGVRTIMVKTHIRALTPSILAINRALFLFAAALIILLIRNETIVIPVRVMINIAIGSFFGPFLTSIGQYSALKYIEASRLAILQSTTAMFVLIGAYLIFGRFPLGYQLAGGAMTIAGPMWLLFVKGRKTKHSA